MNWITSQVAIGNYLEAQDAALLKQHAFCSVLSLDGTLTAKHAAKFGIAKVASYQLIDGPGNDVRVFRRAVESLISLAEVHPPVLVQCHAGRSRSAVIVAAYLMGTQRLDAVDAMALVASKRQVNVTAGLIDLLGRLEA